MRGKEVWSGEREGGVVWCGGRRCGLVKEVWSGDGGVVW